MTEYASTVVGYWPEQAPVTLCELVQGFEGPAGLFRVDHIIGVTESMNGNDFGATYVEMSLIEDWGGDAQAAAIARISGGPGGNGWTALWPVALNQGETVAILLTEPQPANKGYYGINNLALFRPTDSGGVSNGQLFTRSVETTAELGASVRAIRARTDGVCADDAIPDFE